MISRELTFPLKYDKVIPHMKSSLTWSHPSHEVIPKSKAKIPRFIENAWRAAENTASNWVKYQLIRRAKNKITRLKKRWALQVLSEGVCTSLGNVEEFASSEQENVKILFTFSGWVRTWWIERTKWGLWSEQHWLASTFQERISFKWHLLLHHYTGVKRWVIRMLRRTSVWTLESISQSKRKHAYHKHITSISHAHAITQSSVSWSTSGILTAGTSSFFTSSTALASFTFALFSVSSTVKRTWRSSFRCSQLGLSLLCSSCHVVWYHHTSNNWL